MDAPNVERLSITIEKLQSAPMWDDGILYGCPTFPKLKHISIDDPSISAQELALYLAQHPLLEEIVLHRDLEGAVLDLLVNSHITHPHLKRVWATYNPMDEGCYDPRPAAFEEMRNRRTSSSSSSSRYLRDVEHLTLHLLDSDRCSNWMWGPKYDSLWKSTELFSLTRRSALPSSMTEYWDWRLKIAF
ncbi:hypothetical protein DL93DRAFT_2071094 [Clavulina sp. PMI_390]|nr:hypothetical protein DL93DRAFT_2071094 [Clavulina sp. PMI_390]